MKLHHLAALSMAASLFILPALARAQSGVLASETPGVVILPDTLNSQKLAAGATVTADLTHSVKLPNGTELPKGAHLVATVTSDDMQLNGHYKLALRFTEARMKNGKTVPIKATILSVNTQMTTVANDPSTIEAVMDLPSNLNGQLDQIQQDGVTSGVDLHSAASSSDSGVFVTNKDNIKLPRGSKMELALAPASGNAGM